MNRHLTPEELVDLIEGRLEPTRAAHADTCDGCRLEAAELREAVAESQGLDVPEPSPLFWEHQSQRITAALAAERAAQLPWWRGASLRRLSAAAASVLMVAVGIGVYIGGGPGDPSESVPRLTDESVLGAGDAGLENEAAWRLLLAVADGVSWDGQDDQPWVVQAGTIEGAVSELSAVELRDLARLLEAELEGSSL